jgi:cobalt-zinc-cadmium efflux system outer membrane protein
MLDSISSLPFSMSCQHLVPAARTRFILLSSAATLLVFLPVACITSEAAQVYIPPVSSEPAAGRDHILTAFPPADNASLPRDITDAHAALFKGPELTLSELISAVLTRNPTLTEMNAAWQAVLARVPQISAYDDPMFRVTVGPGSISSDTVDFAYRLEISQKIPFPGKLSLRWEQATREADAAASDYLDARLQIIEATCLLYYEYYLVHRALEVNQENLKLLQEARRTAEARVRTGQSPQQELLQIEVELGKQRERELILRRTLTVTKARINALLHRLPDDPLPPPVSQLVPAADLPPLEQLYSSALLHRPDLKAARQRLEAEQLSLALAEREYYPDLEVMAAYDAFWQERPLRTMIGFGVNLPVQLSRRRAALAESLARITRRQAELNRLTDQIHLQVRDAYTRVEENSQLLQLYDKQLIPAAQANVREAVAAYTAGRIPLLGLLEAQRNLVQLRDRYFEILADYYRSRASLERAVGAPLIHDEKATHNHP